ncbi:hypothetical protein [Streptomyces sp. NPDC058434]|uniref:hypothetical protein n=1 Tax=Streptomyces sp. NPDC058434 TaxID=3346498 RepID=UPI0036634B1B
MAEGVPAARVLADLNPFPYRPETLDGFRAGTGLTLDDPASPHPEAADWWA